ncbi:MAG: hypothetical protein ACSW79_00205 [Eubacteriales bacterium]
MKMNLGNLIETGKPRFPKGQIVKSNGTYLVLLLNWNLEANKADRYFRDMRMETASDVAMVI